MRSMSLSFRVRVKDRQRLSVGNRPVDQQLFYQLMLKRIKFFLVILIKIFALLSSGQSLAFIVPLSIIPCLKALKLCTKRNLVILMKKSWFCHDSAVFVVLKCEQRNYWKKRYNSNKIFLMQKHVRCACLYRHATTAILTSLIRDNTLLFKCSLVSEVSKSSPKIYYSCILEPISCDFR